MFIFLIAQIFKPIVLYIMDNEVRVYGIRSRLHISDRAYMSNALFNTNSGEIFVGACSFAGHNVSIITGTHNPNFKMEERQTNCPRDGRDIVIGEGVWIAANATIIGPCIIGDNAVIAAGAIVTMSDVPADTIVAGVPAKIIRKLDFDDA